MDVEDKRKPGRKKDGGDKLEQFSIRLQPKLKFGLDVLAQLQGRSLSQAIEWALHSSLANVKLSHDNSLWLAIENAWDYCKAGWERTFYLYEFDHSLVNFEERYACALIQTSVEMEYLKQIRQESTKKYVDLHAKFSEVIQLYWPAMLRDSAVFEIQRWVRDKKFPILFALGAGGGGSGPVNDMIESSYDKFKNGKLNGKIILMPL